MEERVTCVCICVCVCVRVYVSQVIDKARVPIVKFETVEYGGLAFDVSFDIANGPQVCIRLT